ncbi:Tbingi protein [Trypanosoma cruzi]|nr:Tbingi protein [Trypanosoma cruzi]
MQLVLGHCEVSRSEACDTKSEKASDLSQLTDTWTTGIVALAERIIRARQLKPEARRSAVRGDWELTRTDPTLTRGEEAALARLRSGVSHTIRMAATTTATRHPRNMLLVRRGCRTADTQRT